MERGIKGIGLIDSLKLYLTGRGADIIEMAEIKMLTPRAG